MAEGVIMPKAGITVESCIMGPWKKKVGDSIATNGVCLTATSVTARTFTADVMHETLERSSLGTLTAGSHVSRQLADGAPDGWRARLRAAGVEADLDMRGLGSLPAIRTVFLNHARVALRP